MYKLPKTNVMNGESLDITEQRKQELKRLFPSVFTETINDEGELLESIDFNRLKAELGEFSDVFENRREKYGMDWPGKRDALRLIQEPSRATLKPCREESVDFDNTENLFIEGNNLEVLKLLQKAYYGKVKMIYIDPPYNTGKEFIYPDKYSESLDTYLAYAGLVDDDGRKFTTNTATEGRFHTKWLNMMYPRLYLARNLLRDDGVIFISIDDNEVENLRRMCDEIFGEENFEATLVWQRKYGPANDATGISLTHEYLLVYTKNRVSWSPGLLNRGEKQLKAFHNPDNDPRGLWRASDLSARTFSESGHYSIQGPTGEEFWPPSSRAWIVNENKFKELLTDNRITFGKNNTGRPMQKKFLSEVKQGITPDSWWDRNKAGDNKIARYEIKEIFPDNIFDTPKPTKLLDHCLNVANLNSNDVILDFFAGSCTTAHSILHSNAAGKRNSYIMVQLPEPSEKDNFRTIADIGKERIRRAAAKIKQEKPDYNGDLGFKVLKLNQSNFKHWQAPDRETPDEELIEQLQMHIDHIQTDADPEAILYELLIKAGFMPTEKVATLTLAGKTVYSIGEGNLLICLENSIDQTLIQAIADAEPVQFICLDKAFQSNDQLKANAVQTFKTLNENRDATIEFRTV